MSNKENFEINNDITFTGKKDLEELIADYKELKKVLGTNDKEVNNLYKDFEGMASIVDEINKDLKAVPSDAFKEADKNLKAVQHDAEKATKKLSYWNNELDKPNNAPRRIQEINSKIEGFQHDLEKANKEAQRFGGKKGWLAQQHKDVDISGPVKDYEERVSQLLPKMDLIVLKLLDMKNEAVASSEALQEFDEGAENFTVINDAVYQSALRLKELKQELKEAVPGTQEWEQLTQEIAKEKEVVDSYTKEVNEETAAILKASKLQEELTKESEEAEQAYSRLNPVLESYRSEIEQLTTDFGTFKQEYAANTEVLNDPLTFLRATDQINLFKNKVSEFLDQLEALSQDTSIPITFRAEFLNQVDELSEKTSELYGNIINLEAPIDRIGDMSELHLENLVTFLADIIDEDKELLQTEPSEELEDAIKDNIALATEVGKVWEEVNKDVSIFGELQKAKEEASKQEAVTKEEIRDLEEYSNSLLRINARLKQLRAEQAGLEKKVLANMDTPDDSAQYDKNREEIEFLKQAKEELNSTTEDTVQNLQIEENENVQYSEGLLGVIQRLKDLETEKRELENLDVSERTPDSGARYDEVISEIARLNAEKKEYKATLEGVTAEENKASKSRSNLAKQTKKASSAHKDLDKTLNNVKKSLKKGITMITKYVLGFRSLFFLVRKLKSVVKEGLENLVQFDSSNNQTNKAITELRTSLLYLKNAWAAAVAPILNVVIPILNTLIDAFANVGNAIARFFGALTGQSRVIQAVKADMGDYAKSLDKSAGSSGKASKAADKLHDRLAAFDDLDVLGKDDQTDPNSGGGGGGGGDSDMPNIDDMFKWVDVSEEEFQGIFDFIDKIKKKIEDSGIIEAFKKLWKALKGSKDSKLASTLATIAGIIVDNAFTSALSLVTNLVNLLADILNGDLDASLMDIKSILADLTFDPLIMFAEIIDEILGTNLAGWFKDVKQAFEDVQISELPGYKKLVESIDAIKQAWSDFKEATKDLAVTMEEYGISDMLKNALVWLATEPFDIILHGIATAITLVADALQLVASVFEGDWEGILNNFKNLIIDLLLEPFATLASVIDNLFGTDIEGWIDGIIEKVKEFDLAEWVTSIVEDWDTSNAAFIGGGIVTSETIDKMKTKLKEGKEYIHNAMNNIKNFLSTTWESIKKGATNTFTEMVEVISQVWEGLKDIIKAPINTILGYLNKFISGIEKAINAVIEALNGFSIDIPDWVPEIGGESFGFDIDKISLGRIPYLAQGAVIPPNKEFLAVLGDQKSGTNIEAPLDTIVDAFREVMGSIQVEASNQVLQVDGQTFARLMTPYIVSELSRRGYNVKIIGG